MPRQFEILTGTLSETRMIPSLLRLVQRQNFARYWFCIRPFILRKRSCGAASGIAAEKNVGDS